MTFLPVLPKLTEAAFQRQVIQYATIAGWRYYHTYRSTRSPAGFPDLVLVRRPRVVFLELKGDRTPVTDAQRAWIDDLRACGQEAYIARPQHWERLEKILR